VVCVNLIGDQHVVHSGHCTRVTLSQEGTLLL
jgi:hypothetical protein